MHILLVRFSSLGDVVLQTATINWLRSLFGKELRISFVTSREFTSLLDTHPGVDTVIGYDRRGGEKWSEFIQKIDAHLEAHPVDFILDLHATLRSWRLKLSFWNVPALTVDKRRWERFLLTKIKSKGLKKILGKRAMHFEPQVERIIKDFSSLFGDQRALWRTRDFRKGPHEELTSLGGRPSPVGQKLIIAPGASFLPKLWPVERYVEVAQKLLLETSLEVVVLAGPKDDFCKAFDVIESPRFYNLQGKTSLKESMEHLQTSLLCIGNDSGMNHIAEAYGVPCVTLFGPTDPRFGFAPHGKKSSYISKDLWCKPCSTTGKKPCYRKSHLCMEMISVDEVIGEARRILAG